MLSLMIYIIDEGNRNFSINYRGDRLPAYDTGNQSSSDSLHVTISIYVIIKRGLTHSCALINNDCIDTHRCNRVSPIFPPPNDAETQEGEGGEGIAGFSERGKSDSL